MIYFITEGSNIRIKSGESDFKLLSNTSKCIDWTIYTDKMDLSIDETTFDGIAPTDIYFDGVSSASVAAVVSSLQSMFTNLSSGGASLVQSATVTLTDAQIKALPTTGVEIVAASGAGKVILLLGGSIVSDFSEVYTNLGDPGFQVAYGAYTGAAGADISASYWLGNSDRYFAPISPYYQVYATNTAAVLTDRENLGLQFWGYNNTGDYTGGNAANTLKVTVYYTVVDL